MDVISQIVISSIIAWLMIGVIITSYAYISLSWKPEQREHFESLFKMGSPQAVMFVIVMGTIWHTIWWPGYFTR